MVMISGCSGAKSITLAIRQITIKELYRPVGINDLIRTKSYTGPAAGAKALFQYTFSVETDCLVFDHETSKIRDGCLYRIPEREARQ